jgi:hypothetical protein
MPALLKTRLSFILAAGFAACAYAQGVGQPTYVTSYILQPAGNQTAINNGGTLAFPATGLNASATASFIIYNSAAAPGIVNSITVTGSAFKVSGLPLLPANLAAGAEIRFTITFTPTARGTSTGTLVVDLGTTRDTINLTGQAIGAAVTYTSTLNGATAALTPGGTIPFPSTAIGGSVSADIKVTNTGDANASVNTVNVVGTGFHLNNAPALPATLVPGASMVFTVVFNPTVSGPASGTLVIDNATFTLSSVGLGSSLVYSSVVGSTSTVVQNAGTIVFPNTNVGATSTISVLVNNSGNAAATVSGIAVSGTGFALTNVPKLPATINPGASLQINVAFTASSTNSVTGVLQIDSFGINLRGNGNPPPALTGVSFGSLPATVNPRQQPAVALGLTQPYPLDISGKLTLTFASDSFADDPAIQFASGGRSINFTIPAGTTDAVFSSGKTVQLQTGTVAGTITVTPNFTVAAVDLTPTPAPVAKMAVAAGPPQITTVQVGARTANTVELLITGLSTPRQVSQINLQFTPAQGSSLQTANLFVNTDASFSTWYQSQTGISFGSQFTASVIVNVTGDVNAVQSVAVTASNSRGDSNAVSVNLR